MKKSATFSVIVPTYTGEESIGQCLDAILMQKGAFGFELIVVVDGPNLTLRDRVDAAKEKFNKAKIPLRIKQFSTNQGRFMARLEGAKLAKFEQLLFIDDRALVEPNYFAALINCNRPVVMPNVNEVESKNPVSRSLGLLRTLIYGKKHRHAETSYEITSENFEKSPKGTTSLWVRKDVFVAACKAIYAGGDSREISDDTRLLKAMVEQGNSIYRSSDALIKYKPRSSLKKEIVHIYQRGPRFVDYYLSPGTRFFTPLIGYYLAVCAAVALLILNQTLFLYIAVGAVGLIMILIMAAAKRPKDFIELGIGLPIIVTAFGLGLIKGLFKKLRVGS